MREEREGREGLPGAAGHEQRDNEASNAAHGKQEDHSGRGRRVNLDHLHGNENQRTLEELAGGDGVEKQADKPTGTAREMQESDEGGSAAPVVLPVPDARSRYGVNSAGRLDVGQCPQMARRAFSIADSRQWARLTGDANPIHMSAVSARLFGFRRAILHGAALDAWAATQAGIDGRTPCAGAAYFRAPVMLPATVELVLLGQVLHRLGARSIHRAVARSRSAFPRTVQRNLRAGSGSPHLRCERRSLEARNRSPRLVCRQLDLLYGKPRPDEPSADNPRWEFNGPVRRRGSRMSRFEGNSTERSATVMEVSSDRAWTTRYWTSATGVISCICVTPSSQMGRVTQQRICRIRFQMRCRSR
ncbi:hypothetical protein DDD63_08310 [Actinobaculum sp. 313]|nr:hypothetical protein DDD63_08310 [Actinobaculum sp. 313]